MTERDYEKRRRKSNRVKQASKAKRAHVTKASVKRGHSNPSNVKKRTEQHHKHKAEMPRFRMPSIATEDRKTYRNAKPLKDGAPKRTPDPKSEKSGGRSNVYERFQKIRERRIVRRAGKALIYDENAMLAFLLDNKVPTMMQHCVLKVYARMPGQPKERCISAFNICAATFQNYGYLRKGTMSATGKGMKRNRMHQRERVAGQKKQRFWQLINRLWRAAFARIEKDRRITGA